MRQALRALAMVVLAFAGALTAHAQMPPNNFRLPPTNLPNSGGPPFTYTVRTVDPVRRSGDVVVLGVHWACGESACTATGPWPRPLVPACIALARQIGPVSYAGRPGVTLTAPQIARCNAGLAPAATHASATTNVTTTELVLVGGAIHTPVASSRTVEVPTGEVALVGGAVTALGVHTAQSVEVTTTELTLIGH